MFSETEPGMSDVIERIRSKGHWDIAVRPEPFNAERVPYSGLDHILNKAVVRLRGWPVPFVDYREPLLHGQDWVGQDIDAGMVSHLEAWRFFTSGQFTQLRVVSADWRTGAERTPVPAGASSIIEVWEILFYLTELVELTARLSLSDAGGEQMTIDARLHGLQNRQLVSGTPTRELHANYRANMQSLMVKQTFRRDQLVAEARPIAVGMSRRMFERFGFNASEQVLTDYQRELTDGR